ncbi:MAG TPA: hypothetical protein VFI73_13100 [Candidatus Nitrosopolaris sp.]|nr:hypothetical protein [Candidatus Nitrosopolaris sp.]
MLIEFTKMPKASTIVFRKLMITIPIVLLLLVPIAQSVQLVNAQNSTASNASGGTEAKTNITTTGNKTVIIIPGAPAKSSSVAAPSYNRTGFTNLYTLTINGKTFPIKYSINGGKLVGILADKDRTSLVLVLNPSANGGNFTTELPRNVIDSKGASNADTKYLIKIDGKGVDYKEIANNVNARILTLDFSKDNRFIEIIGTQMTS